MDGWDGHAIKAANGRSKARVCYVLRWKCEAGDCDLATGNRSVEEDIDMEDLLMEVILLSRGLGGHEKRRVRGKRIMNSLGEQRGGDGGIYMGSIAWAMSESRGGWNDVSRACVEWGR